MKLLAIVLLALLVLVLGALVVLSLLSRQPPPLGEIDGRLRPCPPTPNCVVSEHPGEARVEPLRFEGDPGRAWQRAERAVTAEGGEIVEARYGYLHAVFRTPLLRFRDDLEMRLDERQNIIHLRSASRVGHSDLGANQARVDRLRERFRASAVGAVTPR